MQGLNIIEKENLYFFILKSSNGRILGKTISFTDERLLKDTLEQYLLAPTKYSIEYNSGSKRYQVVGKLIGDVTFYKGSTFFKRKEDANASLKATIRRIKNINQNA